MSFKIDRFRTTSRRVAWSALAGCMALSSGCTAWSDSQRAATHSCIASIAANLRAQQLESAVGSDWAALDEATTDQLLSRIGQSGNHDCGSWDGRQPLLDAWHHRIIVRMKKAGSGQPDVQVSSNGPDGIDGTADDIQAL